MFLQKLFGKSEEPLTKSQLYTIAIHDEEMNKELAKIIISLQEKIRQFRMHATAMSIVQKDEQLQALYQEVLLLREKIRFLEQDVEKIITIELENKDYFIIKDDAFVLDKKEQLQSIKEQISAFIQILEQRPSLQDLEQELLGKLSGELTAININLNRIVKDDLSLRTIYRKLKDI